MVLSSEYKLRMYVYSILLQRKCLTLKRSIILPRNEMTRLTEEAEKIHGKQATDHCIMASAGGELYRLDKIFSPEYILDFEGEAAILPQMEKILTYIAPEEQPKLAKRFRLGPLPREYMKKWYEHGLQLANGLRNCDDTFEANDEMSEFMSGLKSKQSSRYNNCIMVHAAAGSTLWPEVWDSPELTLDFDGEDSVLAFLETLAKKRCPDVLIDWRQDLSLDLDLFSLLLSPL